MLPSKALNLEPRVHHAAGGGPSNIPGDTGVVGSGLGRRLDDDLGDGGAVAVDRLVGFVGGGGGEARGQVGFPERGSLLGVGVLELPLPVPGPVLVLRQQRVEAFPAPGHRSPLA